MSRHYGPFQVLAAATLWGTTGPVEVLAKLPVAPAAVGGTRILTGGLVLLAWALARRTPRPLAFPAVVRRHWRPLLAASCATGVFQAAYFTSVSRTGAALATTIVFGVAPLVTGLSASVIGRSRLSRGWAAGTGCAVAGCVLLLLPGYASRPDGTGVVLAIVAAGCYAAYTVSAKRLTDDGAAMPVAVSATLIAGGLMLTPWLATAGAGSVHRARAADRRLAGAGDHRGRLHAVRPGPAYRSRGHGRHAEPRRAADRRAGRDRVAA